MINTEKISAPLIREYLKSLTKTFKIRDLQSETALEILFKQKLYAECVLELMSKMEITNKVKVLSYPDDKFLKEKAAAFIAIPDPMPDFGSKEFKEWKISISIRKSLLPEYYPFLYNILHELSHLVLHSTHHELRVKVRLQQIYWCWYTVLKKS